MFSLDLQVVARRGVLGGLAGSLALLSSVKPSEAAFGEAARVSKDPYVNQLS